MSDDKALQVLAPEVRTLARPASGPLLAARGVVQRSPTLQGAFVQAKAEQWGEDRLAGAIEEALGATVEGTPEEIRQTALYLAAEYLQFGDTLLLISRETGRAIARITDDDLWQPPAVPRESGGMVKPLPRLRPELEGFLYEYVHQHDREAKLTADLAVRTKQTAFLAAEGDRRLHVATREGRRSIEREIQAMGDNILLGAQGIVRSFLSYLESETVEGPPALSAMAMARTRTEIPDLVAVNYRYDHLGSQHVSLVNEWVREVARSLGIEAHRQLPPRAVRFADIGKDDLQGATFWVADPAVSSALYRVPGVSVFHVPGVRPFGFSEKPLGRLLLDPGSLRVEGREMLGHWDVMGRFSYTLDMDWAKVRTLEVTDIPLPITAVEVLPR